MSGNTVSIIIPAFNAKAFVGRAINSALEQSLPPLEVIVVDDCSNDGTREWLRIFSDGHPNVKILALPQNGGPSAARNVGIEAAQGDWVAILDADDAFASDRLKNLVSFAQQTDSDLVADDLAYYDAAAEAVVGRGLGETGAAFTGAVTLKDFLVHNLADDNGMDWGLLKPMFKRSMLLEQGIRYDENIKHGEDFRLVVDLLLAGRRFHIFPEPFYLYTQRYGTQSRRPSGLTRTTIAYGKMKDAVNELALDPRICHDPKLVQLLRLRAKGLSRHDDAQYIATALRNGDCLGLIKKVANDTGFFPFMCAQLGRAIRRRLYAGYSFLRIFLVVIFITFGLESVAYAATKATHRPIYWGVNDSGLDFGHGDIPWKNFAIPNPSYYLAHGVTLVRIPFQIARLQPTPDGPLAPAIVRDLQMIITKDQAAGAITVLDPHGYGFFDVDGQPQDILKNCGAASDYLNFIWQVARTFKGDDIALGLMNEPHTGNDVEYAKIWNAAIAAVRRAGFHGVVLVPHAHWETAADISPATPYQGQINDPDKNWVLEVHSYLDPDGSGTYKQPVASTDIGAKRLAGVIAWSRQTGIRVFLGETGGPADPASLAALKTMYTEIKSAPDVFWGIALWGGGAWWKPNYPMRLDPINGVDRPQFTALEKAMDH